MLPAYLIMLSSLIILFFSVFKAESIIFQRNAYDILVSLPITQTAIVVSRFIRMYVENMLLTFVIMLPPMAVYGIMIKPGISFYIIGILVTIFIPLLPITISIFLGALITAIASRMKHKSLARTVLSIVLILGILVGSSLDGFICKPPVYRTTPFNREITDFLLAVNRSYNKSDYIPCISWGRNARFCGKRTVGENVRVIGRMQSRTYEKKFPDGSVVQKTAYEISVAKIELHDNDIQNVADDINQ